MPPVAAALALTPSARQPSLMPDEHTPLRPGRLLLLFSALILARLAALKCVY